MKQADFAKLFEDLGCKCAYNLDGGGSATMVFMGKVINHPCDKWGERAVGDIVYFGESETDRANIERINNP
jgi:exopolysaccharide biosynthesis protein